MSTAYKRHGGDCHWHDINCRKCGTWVDEWYDKGYNSEPDDICDKCERKVSKKAKSKSRDEIRYQNVRDYVGRGCFICPETFAITDKGILDRDSFYCDDCDTVHYED